MTGKIDIAGRAVGTGCPCFIIAEAGVNHNGKIETARSLIDTAVLSGADAVKFQTFKANRVVTKDSPKAGYQKKTTGESESQYEMLERLELSIEDHYVLSSYCKEKGILFMSTPFDELSADLLDELGVPVFKIPSGEIVNHPFLAHVARKGKPIIISTGMSTLGEVETALNRVREAGCEEIVLLHCVTDYPAEPETSNLKAIHTMAEAFQVPVGFSDHTPGIEVSLLAVALGASVIEKHFTIDKNLPGPDHGASLEPEELKDLVSGIRRVEVILGDGEKKPTQSELENMEVIRKSLVAAVDIPAGAKITDDMIAVKRPGVGLAPEKISDVVGRCAREDIPADTPLLPEMFK